MAKGGKGRCMYQIISRLTIDVTELTCRNRGLNAIALSLEIAKMELEEGQLKLKKKS